MRDFPKEINTNVLRLEAKIGEIEFMLTSLEVLLKNVISEVVNVVKGS